MTCNLRSQKLHKEWRIKLEEMLRDYYKSYYSIQLGLKDWQERVNARINEEEHFALPMIKRLEEWLNYDFKNKKVLVIGAGTGAETIILHRRGAEVYAIEPNPKAIDILFAKCKIERIPFERIHQGVAENIRISAASADYCFSGILRLPN